MDSRSQAGRIVVIGVGNPDRGDDAVGLHVARELGRAPVGDAAILSIYERSGEATALMEAWAGARAVIVIDAVMSGAEPGTVHRLDAAAAVVPGSILRCSTHAFGVADAIELGRVLRTLPPRVTVYGIEGGTFEHGADLSPEVERAVVEVVARVRADVSSLVQE